MPQAIVDPDQLERFAQNLRQFTEALQKDASQLNAKFSQLGATWRDQEHQKFAATYLETMRTIDRFVEAASEHTPFLLRKAQSARAYLDQH